MTDFIPIDLPSRCLTYTKEDKSPVSPGSISARAYQGRDEIYLSQINPINLEKNYFEVLKSVIQGVDPLQLTLGDRMYLMLWEYLNSYSRTMKIRSICSHCFSDVVFDVDLGSLDIVKLPEDYKQPVERILPESGEKVRLRLLNVEDEMEVEKFSKKNREDAKLYRYARTIVDDSDVFSRIDRLGSMAAKDYLSIVAFQDKFFHGPVLETPVVCPMKDCGEEDTLDIPFRFEFLVPAISEFHDIDGARV